MTQYRYGVLNIKTGELWRDHFETPEEALEWVKDWNEMGGKPIFEPIKAKIEWEPLDG